MILDHAEMPRRIRNFACHGGLPISLVAGQGAHVHRVPARDAEAIEREAMRSGRIDLVNDVFVVARRVRADAA